MNLGFHPGSVWLLLLLLLVPLAWLPRWRRRRAELMHSSVKSLEVAGSSWVSRNLLLNQSSTTYQTNLPKINEHLHALV